MGVVIGWVIITGSIRQVFQMMLVTKMVSFVAKKLLPKQLSPKVVTKICILKTIISACCADKCAYYYNLTFNIILCLAFVAGDLYFGIMEDVTWDIAGGALGAVLFVMAIMIGLVCALCTDR